MSLFYNMLMFRLNRIIQHSVETHRMILVSGFNFEGIGRILQDERGAGAAGWVGGVCDFNVSGALGFARC